MHAPIAVAHTHLRNLAHAGPQIVSRILDTAVIPVATMKPNQPAGPTPAHAVMLDHVVDNVTF